MVESICLGPLRLLNIPGFEQRTNDVIYCYPLKSSENTDVVVFFGGDVQVRKCHLNISIMFVFLKMKI